MNMNSKRCGSAIVILVLMLTALSGAWAAGREMVLHAFHGKDGRGGAA